jgi:glycosyltransferase involved in cell wall biosynthesis
MEKKKKILYIITYLELGGAQKYLLSLVQNIDKRKYSVFLLSGCKGYLKKEFEASGAIESFKFLPHLDRGLDPWRDLVSFFGIYRYIKKNKFDIVHVHSPKASVLGRWAAFFAGTQNIFYTVHGWPFHSYMNIVMFNIYRLIEKLTAFISNKIIVVSKADLDKGIQFRIANPDKFKLVHYGINTEIFTSVYKKRQNKKSINRNLILTVSCLKPQKGLSFFIAAAGELIKDNPNLRFVIAGSGPLEAKVVRQIERKGLTGVVSLKGWVRDIPEYLSQTGLFVLSSLWEGLPLALIEALVSGVPVVVTDTGGPKDILKNKEAGLIVEPASVKDLVLGIKDMLKKNMQDSIITDNKPKHIDISYWSQERMVKQTQEVYSEV